MYTDRKFREKELTIVAEERESPAILLRGHHLLCIQGFRGYGYSKEFVAGMWAVVNRLKDSRETEVTVTDAPDQICVACPHRDGDSCPEAGSESSGKDTGHDRRVLDQLGLAIGDRVQWSVVLDKIRATVRPEDLARLCRDCQWLSYGFCAEGLKALVG